MLQQLSSAVYYMMPAIAQQRALHVEDNKGNGVQCPKSSFSKAGGKIEILTSQEKKNVMVKVCFISVLYIWYIQFRKEKNHQVFPFSAYESLRISWTKKEIQLEIQQKSFEKTCNLQLNKSLIIGCYAKALLGLWSININPFSRQDARCQSKILTAVRGKGEKKIRKQYCKRTDMRNWKLYINNSYLI